MVQLQDPELKDTGWVATFSAGDRRGEWPGRFDVRLDSLGPLAGRCGDDVVGVKRGKERPILLIPRLKRELIEQPHVSLFLDTHHGNFSASGSTVDR